MALSDANAGTIGDEETDGDKTYVIRSIGGTQVWVEKSGGSGALALNAAHIENHGPNPGTNIAVKGGVAITNWDTTKGQDVGFTALEATNFGSGITVGASSRITFDTAGLYRIDYHVSATILVQGRAFAQIWGDTAGVSLGCSHFPESQNAAAMRTIASITLTRQFAAADEITPTVGTFTAITLGINAYSVSVQQIG